MARPREFDEAEVLEAAARCFWASGYEATSMRDLIGKTGITGASLYNAFGDKRALYLRALEHYVEAGIADRVRRFQQVSPRLAIAGFFAEIVERSVTDAERKGCMLVNAALEGSPDDPEAVGAVAGALDLIEAFFQDRVEAGQREGSIAKPWSAEQAARHLLGVLIGVRVLARIRPERKVLEDVVAPALALLAIKPASE